MKCVFKNTHFTRTTQNQHKTIEPITDKITIETNTAVDKHNLISK